MFLGHTFIMHLIFASWECRWQKTSKKFTQYYLFISLLVWVFYRSKWSIFSTSEAEELVEVIIYFFLDRQLQGLSVLLYECTQAVIGYFADKEWEGSCERIAKSLACRLMLLFYCFRSISNLLQLFIALWTDQIPILSLSLSLFWVQRLYYDVFIIV